MENPQWKELLLELYAADGPPRARSSVVGSVLNS